MHNEAFSLPDLLLLLELPVELSDNDSSLLLITDVLSDSDELWLVSIPRYTRKLSRLVKSGGSEKDCRDSVSEAARLGGEGWWSRS